VLRFDLHQTSTIDINGKEFDKTTLLKTIQRLETDADFHIRVNRNSRLLFFLENGDLRFFYDFESWKDLEDANFQEQLRPFFVHQFSQTIYKAVSNPKGNGIAILDRIFKSKFELPATYQEACYAKTFRFLEKLIGKATEKYHQPFENFRKITFKRGIEQYYNAHFRKVFLILPISFETLKQRYWAAGRAIIYDAFKTEIKFTRFERKTLKKLLEISNICNDLHYEKDMIALRDDIDNYVNKKWSGWRSIYLLIFLGVMLGRIIIAITTNSSMSTPPPTYTIPGNVMSQEDFIGTWETNFRRKGEATLSEILILNDAGEGSAEFILPLERSRKEKCALTVPVTWSYESTFLQIRYGAIFDRNCKFETTTEEAALIEVLSKIEKEIAGMELKEKPITIGKTIDKFFFFSHGTQPKKYNRK